MRRFLVASALFLLSQGCTANRHEGVRPLRPLEIATAPYEETITEELTGSLLYENGCLLFRDDRTKVRLLPIWPEGSIFNGTSIIVHRPGDMDQPVLIAQEFVLSGRPVEWRALSHLYYRQFEQQCQAEPFLVSKVRPAD